MTHINPEELETWVFMFYVFTLLNEACRALITFLQRMLFYLHYKIHVSSCTTFLRLMPNKLETMIFMEIGII